MNKDLYIQLLEEKVTTMIDECTMNELLEGKDDDLKEKDDIIDALTDSIDQLTDIINDYENIVKDALYNNYQMIGNMYDDDAKTLWRNKWGAVCDIAKQMGIDNIKYSIHDRKEDDNEMD